MVKAFDNIFVLETKETTYALQVMDTGHLEHLYYGKSIPMDGEVARAISGKHVNLNGCAVQYDKEHPALCMNDVLLEVSGRGTGDFRSPFVELDFADGNTTVDFVFESYEIMEGKRELESLPSAYAEGEQAQTLKIVLREKYMSVKLELYYSVFEDCNVITRSCKLANEGADALRIKRLMSMQLDLNGSNLVMTSFHGDWAREMNRVDVPVRGGRVVNTSSTGFSSNHANPFVMLFSEGSSEDAGEGYGFHLIYSGPHMELAEVSSQGQTRFLTGISPEQFSWKLEEGESFETPEAVMTFSDRGYGKMSENMHRFVREHIVRGPWKKRERPVLLNSWEASYFNITESSLLKLAKAGKDAGVELFVMDDGWFGERDNDTCSLGDWEVNTKKLPGGIKGLADKVVKLGLMFGIWVEPEMVNEDSNLYREHPDWAIKHPSRNHGEGRHQMLLDLSRVEVQDYLIEAMSKVFSAGDITYVKWDMNRNFSDVYSTALDAALQGELLHRYIMGLYRVMGELVKKFPHILFEGCASGGNRFDLGILCYMPQIWASDNSDAISRCYIQNGLSYGYPQSVMGAHVSSCPNHQTLRNTPLETRFAVASMGVLGYEYNLAEMKKEELEAIKEQIALYKKWRKTLQFGQMYRIGGKLAENTLQVGLSENQNLVSWNIVSQDGKEAVAVMVQDTVKPHISQITLRTKGLVPEYMYHFTNRILKYDIKLFGDLVNMISPIHIKKDSLVHNAVAKFIKMDGEVEDYTLPGSVLNNCGIALAQSFAGTGYNPNTRLYKDFDARMYFMEKV